MTPEAVLKETMRMEKQLIDLLSKSVVVGYPKEKVGAAVYAKDTDDVVASPATVLEVATLHEYGDPESNVPRRSMLRVPFTLKANEIAKATSDQMLRVLRDGVPVETALGLVGVKAQSIVIGAFRTKGYGTWPDLQEATIAAKGRSSILITTNTLRGSVTWLIR